jgi:hypothetical protein
MQLRPLNPTWTPLLLLTWMEGVLLLLLLLLRGGLWVWLKGQVLADAALSDRDLIRHGAQLLTWPQHHPHELIPPAKVCCCDASPGGDYHPTPLIPS